MWYRRTSIKVLAVYFLTTTTFLVQTLSSPGPEACPVFGDTHLETHIHPKRHLFAHHIVQGLAGHLNVQGNAPAEVSHASIVAQVGSLVMEPVKERRQKLDLVRPKIVKVRHASAKHEKILNEASFRSSGFDLPDNNTKMQQLKMEARVTSIRRQPLVNSAPSASSYSCSSSNPRSTAFGAAVACASTGKTVNGKQMMARATKSIALAGGKRTYHDKVIHSLYI
ncbi:hypothetical protein IV203_027285 [Nitzschia inconspicua]|uniref:Secreted protein n=1 Tax=Nitzschia inconspicua TaxID=303405 RepID=A0A9K3Q5W0_9STRA|nr:hypothetical protein IV203_027285 [Nitzschia inconspicua]